MARQYATAAEFTASEWATTEPPAGELDSYLMRATRAVERMTVTAVYNTDTAGMPTDTAIREAFRDATCAQVAYWANTGDIDGSVAAGGSMSIGSVSLGATAKMSTDVRARQDARYAPEAVSILMLAGLTPTGVN